MDSASLVEQAKRIKTDARLFKGNVGVLAEALEFTRIYAGERSAFYRKLTEVEPDWNEEDISKFVRQVLDGFVHYVENDLLGGMSIQRQAQVDVVSDILEQAQGLLNTKEVHPAAPAVLIGAVLEEFLRNWVEDAGLELGSRKPGIDAYSVALRKAEQISKQDVKDIASWAGIRNDAAHGQWNEVGDKERVRLMLEAVNLFMRKYSR